MDNLDIAVLIPCHNEEATVGRVVEQFREVLPLARVYVYDNNSTDRTIEYAIKAGAVVYSEPLQGKGNVVRRMFADVEADIYILVDGDATYHAPGAPDMVKRLVNDNLDMVTGRREEAAEAAYRPGHQLGNYLLTGMVRLIFGTRVSDMLSGYRVMSRRFVKSFPAHSRGFEIETELTVHALEMRMAMAEVPGPYAARPEGSESKLNTYRDGIRILSTIVNLVRDERPLLFFGLASLLAMIFSFGLGIPVILDYLETGLVPRFPTAILSTGMALVGLILFTAGLILDSVVRGRREIKRFHYLALSRYLGTSGNNVNG